MKDKFREYVKATVEQMPDDNEANAPAPKTWPYDPPGSTPPVTGPSGRPDWPDGVGR